MKDVDRHEYDYAAIKELHGNAVSSLKARSRPRPTEHEQLMDRLIAELYDVGEHVVGASLILLYIGRGEGYQDENLQALFDAMPAARQRCEGEQTAEEEPR